ncbi:MAG: bifunctional [glutamate--ammonia ligase]-adenylyl-L-tyrosine phosphorylase/[glutamate--ammonia-ligase] adenylyltransferase [Pseudomonadota bacterium]|nr:bifunctional [glutamate--ammonia ligase]-adenylyl-L-tyrosine phosphorylase/[glutamate--ammonia-ligase] adenylyltransferase [Pseudomonadota bacterium]
MGNPGEHSDPSSQAERALSRLRALTSIRSLLEDPVQVDRLRKVAVVSEFAVDTMVRQPELLAQLARDPEASADASPLLDPSQPDAWPRLLRRYRAAESTRLVWRDVLGLDRVGDTLAGSTALAETCLRAALEALEHDFARRHGRVPGPDGAMQRLVVFGLGKLGGGELNFSSDIDLVYAYEHGGAECVSDGPRPLAAETYFTRLGQQLAKLLDEVTADGFSHRVDLRLRPYGNSGRLAWSFAAMELYFQREGRDWERYAWQKARPVAGDMEAGERFLETLRPFVYRRYLDYGALDGLRAMKGAISAEVARQELADDIKRGPGGIREIEFLVQALQLIRGGREPELRGRSLLPMLDALVEAHQVDPQDGEALAAAYRFLRRLENRLQMLRDAQTHALPEDPADQSRIAAGLEFPDWASLRQALDAWRERVSTEFGVLLAPRSKADAPGALATYWHRLRDSTAAREKDGATLAAAGFPDAGNAETLLRDFARSPGVTALSDSASVRLDRVMPALLHAAGTSREPPLALRRLLALLHNILRRSAYLALLDEQPAALARLVEVVSESALLAERLATYPLLLDELLDARVSGPLPGREEILEACAAVADHADATAAVTDTEATLQALNEVRQALSFRTAMALRDGRQGPVEAGRQLAWLADGVVERVLVLAEQEVATTHGRVPGARFAVVGYGSLGGEELGFGSDLDLVFLYDAGPDAQSDGQRPLEAARWFARLAQKMVSLLGAVTAAGRLFDVDVRLRPDGAKGLLVSTLGSFADYQRSRAWNWEHQALVRARGVAGDRALCRDFETIRAETLGRPREAAQVSADVVKMRSRMRAELDRSDAARFDLKQGEGGLVDLEFLLQAMVLAHAHRHPALLEPRTSPGLLAALRDSGILGDDCLPEAHALLLARSLGCTLDRRSRQVESDQEVDQARSCIREAAGRQGYVFMPRD